MYSKCTFLDCLNDGGSFHAPVDTDGGAYILTEGIYNIGIKYNL